MTNATIYTAAERFVEDLFSQNPNDNLTYHNLEHTKRVVAAANEIAAHTYLTEEQLLTLNLAAWFHDTGYLFTTPAEHEAKSVEIFKGFAEQQHIDEPIVSDVADGIMATKFPVHPKTVVQEILCDADTFHFGTKQFRDSNEAIYEELSNTSPGKFSREEFDRKTRELLTLHAFHTAYARENLVKGKQKNLSKMTVKESKNKGKNKKQQTSANGDKTEIVYADSAQNQDIKLSDGNASSITAKGIQTMLRLTSSNHMQLSDMADSKANILISVNAIIISIILSVLMKKIQVDDYLTIPTLIFLIVAVTTIVLAILATRPKVNTGTFREEDIINKKTNLLFFGNFHRMALEDYKKAMTVMMTDPDYLYNGIVQDIYYLGVVLGKKYRLLRIAYNIFMFGIIISVIAFAVASYYAPSPEATNTITNSGGSPF